MAEPNGTGVFADLGLWSGLRDNECSKLRLREAALHTSLPNGETGADRVMFGTDWFMLSRVAWYGDYPQAIQDAIDDPSMAIKIFGDNAQKLFSRL